MSSITELIDYKSPQELENFKQYTTLSLIITSLNTFDKEIFKKLHDRYISLTKLSLHMTTNIFIPKTLTNLKILNISNNICMKELPKELINLTYLNCSRTKIKEIPETLINLKFLLCYESNMEKIPKTLINLVKLEIHMTEINKIPNTLIKLASLSCCMSRIKKIPNTLISLTSLLCDKNVKIPEELDKLVNIMQ